MGWGRAMPWRESPARVQQRVRPSRKRANVSLKTPAPNWLAKLAQRQAAVQAARKVAEAISTKLIENLRAASDLAERQYRVGALGVNLLVEAHREYLDALESRNEAVIQAGATASTSTF